MAKDSKPLTLWGKFETYLGGQSFGNLAAAIGCDRTYLWRIAKGERQVSAELAVKIETATGGKITRHDLRPDLFAKAVA